MKVSTSTLSRAERLSRFLIRMLPPKEVVSIYSKGRLKFLEALENEIPEEPYNPPKSLERTLWGLNFRTHIMNAAGMFKNGGGHPMVFRQGAGAYLGGTGTWNSRIGNEKLEIKLPFVTYPNSHAASNWLGLPNDGDEINSQKVAKFERIDGFPIGWSVMSSPDFQGEERLEYLVKGMRRYEYAGVDFLEINESCPNTTHGKPQDDDLANRLKYIKKNFLDRRTISGTDRLREIPVIVKFSNDTEIDQLSALLDLLFELGFDGVTFGNTSTRYKQRRELIDIRERKLYDFYNKTFGGGVSGKPLKEISLELASRAVEYLKSGPPSQEFHVIRTGGIETWKDIQDSEEAGISLNQWYTGYFEKFAEHGHDVYKQLFENSS